MLRVVRNPDPGVDDGEAQRRVVIDPRDVQPHRTRIGELDRVADEVEEYLAQPAGVASECAGHVARELALQDDVLLLCPGPEEGGDARLQVVEIEVGQLQIEFARLHLREVEDVVQDTEERCPTRGW